MNSGPRPSVLESFNNAIEGIVHVLRTQRNMRIHFALAVAGYAQLCRQIESTGARIIIEGWPGRAPHYSSLACTPAEVREVFHGVTNIATHPMPLKSIFLTMARPGMKGVR